MHALALCVLLAAAPPAAKAKTLVAQKAWEDLYLAYSAADPKGYSDKDRKEIGAALVKGASALEASDAVMAYSLAERAVLFDDSSQALLLYARTAKATQQTGAAEDALKTGLKAHPEDGSVALALGQLLLDENDLKGAIDALSKVPKKAKEFAKAQALLQKAKKGLSEDTAARNEAQNLERKLNGGGVETLMPMKTPVKAVAHDEGETLPTNLTYESSEGPGGMRTRANSRFRFRYFNDQRDFGQRAEYEGRVAAALDEAYNFSQSILGETRQKPLDVILYTREEFALHQGEAYAKQVAGLYSQGAIRMNDSAEINDNTRATLVHEYVHSVIDNAASDRSHAMPTWFNEGIAEYVEWRYQGGDGPPYGMKVMLKQAAAGGGLPSLKQMSGGMLVETSNPALAYAYSAVAVRIMLKSGGPENLMAMVHEVGAGKPFDQAFEAHYGRSVEALDQDAHTSVAGD